MRRMRFALLCAIFAIIASAVVTRPAATPPANIPSLQTIRYDELGDRVGQEIGRVVVVDFWADYCAPCKKEFPKLVELHRQYASKGLIAVSVALDDPTDEAARRRIQKFLAAKQATFANYLLAEKPELWQTKLKVSGPPCVFLFDRRGRLVKRYDDHVDYADIERLVIDLLK